jgi:hypothetical protein
MRLDQHAHIAAGAILSPVLASVLACGNVQAKEKTTDIDSAPLATSYVWHDGDQKREVWLDSDLVAEFAPSASGEAGVKRVNPNAQAGPSPKGIRLWRMMGAMNSDVVSRRANAETARGVFSPVLHDAATDKGAMRLLPGNVIVHLNPTWDTGTAYNWFKTRKLEVAEQLGYGANIFLIRTGPGLEALETANRIYESGDVVAAFPNWWVEMQKK